MGRGRRIKAGEAIDLRLSDAERRMILGMTAVPMAAEKVLLRATEEEGAVHCLLTYGELDELADYVASAANHARGQKLEAALDQVYNRIAGLLDNYVEAQGPEPPGFVAPGAWQRTSGSAEVPVPAELAKRVAKVLDRWHEQWSRPDPELAGLTPAQVGRLLHADWDDPAGALQINESLTLDDLADAPALQNARIFLGAVMEADGIKATAGGNLNLKFVSSMAAAWHGLDDFTRNWALEKSWKEEDLYPVNELRIILGLAGLLRRYKGVFKVVKKRQHLLDDSEAGALLALLFRTYFRKFNLAYAGRLPSVPEIQDTIAFSLFTFARYGDEWQDPDELAPSLLLPAVKARIPEMPFGDCTHWFVERRVLHPLEELGLVERRELPSEEQYVHDYEVRKSSLFDRFLSFDLEIPPSDT